MPLIEEEREGNEIIAVFMGGHIEEATRGVFKHNRRHLNFPFGSYSTPIGYDVILIEDLGYHISWDWLMPVVEKIESLEFDFRISFVNAYGNLNYNYHSVHIETHDGNDVIFNEEKFLTKIQAVYKAVLEFIHWYNTQEKKEEVK